MAYIIATLMRKAIAKARKVELEEFPTDPEDLWKHLMLLPNDYSQRAIFNEYTRTLMEKVQFEHGGEEYDKLYPEGIPTSISITT